MLTINLDCLYSMLTIPLFGFVLSSNRYDALNLQNEFHSPSKDILTRNGGSGSANSTRPEIVLTAIRTKRKLTSQVFAEFSKWLSGVQRLNADCISYPAGTVFGTWGWPSKNDAIAIIHAYACWSITLDRRSTIRSRRSGWGWSLLIELNRIIVDRYCLSSKILGVVTSVRVDSCTAAMNGCRQSVRRGHSRHSKNSICM